jgi:hypothetical protein
MVAGQNIYIPGAGYFAVVSKPTTTSTILTYLQYAGNTETGETVAAGAGVSPAGTQGPNATLLPTLSDYGVGGSQALTDSSVQLLTASVTLTTAGNYLLMATVRLDKDVVTFPVSQTITLKLRETTVGADVPNAIVNLATGTPTAESGTLAIAAIPPVDYTATAGDEIQIFGSIDATAYAGAIEAVEISLLAIKLF